jgi:Holliday junction resolvase RusA-like endonuclease
MKNIKPLKCSAYGWDACQVTNGYWLTLPLTPPSQNEYLRWHWSRRKRYLDELSENLSLLALAFRIPRFEHATIQITYFFAEHRQRDKDNYNGKFILDALKNAGILLDDRASLIKLPEPGFAVDHCRPRTEIQITTEGAIPCSKALTAEMTSPLL